MHALLIHTLFKIWSKINAYYRRGIWCSGHGSCLFERPHHTKTEFLLLFPHKTRIRHTGK